MRNRDITITIKKKHEHQIKNENQKKEKRKSHSMKLEFTGIITYYLELLEQDEDKADQTVQLLHNFQEVSLRAIMQFCVLHYFTHYLCTHSLHSFTFLVLLLRFRC